MGFHKHIQLVGRMTVGPKGQVVIPADIRDHMGIGPGDKLIALYFADKKSLGIITEDQAQSFVDKMGENYTHLKDAVEKTVDTAPEGWD